MTRTTTASPRPFDRPHSSEPQELPNVFGSVQGAPEPDGTGDEAAQFEVVLAAEIEYIRTHRHPKKAHADVAQNLVGLALSGGGIRSATTNLGTLQALSRMGVLPMVDYLSTVSGGGYIGGCLSSLLSWNGNKPGTGEDAGAAFTFDSDVRPCFTTEWPSFPFRAERLADRSDDHGDAQVRHLRTHGNFLIARLGLLRRETMRSIGNLLTGITYNLLAFLLLLFAASALYLAAVLALAPELPSVFKVEGRWEPASRTMALGERRATTSDVALGQRLQWNACQLLHGLAIPWNPRSCGPRSLSREPSAAAGRLSWLDRLAPPHKPLLIAFAVGVAFSLAALVWVQARLGRYLRYLRDARTAERTPNHQSANDIPPPEEGESEEDSFERRILWQLGAAVALTALITLILLRSELWPTASGVGVDGGAQVAWLFVPFAVFFGAWVTGLFLGTAFIPWRGQWTRRLRSMWGGLQAITIYGGSATLLLGALPVGIYAVRDHTVGAVIGAVGSLIASRLLASRAAALAGRRMRLPPELRRLFLGVSVALAVGLLVLFFCALLAGEDTSWKGVGLHFAIAATVFAAFGYLTNHNRIGPHYFYRDRLAETYLLTEIRDRKRRLRVFRDAMEMPLRSLHGQPGSGAGRWRNTAPYHLISAAINLAGSRDLTRKDRKSGYWLFAKLYCGSKHTGFRPTKDYRMGETKLARALTISGAAVSSAMGSGGFFAQAFATVLFNIRLGYWMENPHRQQCLRSREGRVFWPLYLWKEVTMKTTEHDRLVNLSDGGHTGDNVGIYPLLERRCKVIIACDAERDPALTFGSFTEALRHAYIDMGVSVDIDLTMLRPDPTTGMSRSHCAVGRIRYPDQQDQESYLIYIKSSLTGDEPEPVLNYKSQFAAFPHESTADQFFDDAQFESYRALGVHLAEHTFGRWITEKDFSAAYQQHSPVPIERPISTTPTGKEGSSPLKTPAAGGVGS